LDSVTIERLYDIVSEARRRFVYIYVEKSDCSREFQQRLMGANNTQ
jgi:hypothetical protein